MRKVKSILVLAVTILMFFAVSGQALAKSARFVLPGPKGSTVYVFTSGKNSGGLDLLLRDVYGQEWNDFLRYIIPIYDWMPGPSVPKPPVVTVPDKPQKPEEPQKPTEPQEPQEPQTPEDTPVTPVDPPEDVTGLTANEQAMLDLVNKERERAGLAPLKADMKLVELARMKSQDMIDKGYFAHTSPTYGSPFDMMEKAGVTYRSAGENLAGAGTVDTAHVSLMNSEGHRRNIMNPSFDHVGIGIIEGGPYGMMFTQMFTGQ